MATLREPHRGYPGIYYVTRTLDADKIVCEMNTACTICHWAYYDESGCDPCPKCGASFASQCYQLEEGSAKEG